MTNNLMQIVALVEMSITCSALLILLFQAFARNGIPFFAKGLFVLIFANLFFWPLGISMELPLAAYIRGVTGDLSIVSTLLLWSALLPNHQATPTPIKWCIAIVAIIFYPFALGVSMFDPYAWGYGSIAFLIGVLIFALICGLAAWTKGVWIIGFAIIAWSFHWHESNNLWDYLLDPALAIWALFAALDGIRKQRKEKARSGYLFRPG
ncbi:hypothetical protein DCO17_04240 [Polynucleobacter tropicus]|uniref:Uncharacterized protein n=1 Tax=Polynucleobacter tropicus TaxID=1743174 RepID=A0A6M9Q6K8_9BURK|nr:hypothetical protein [Polynucleobacter tropicus]QKM64513.1 hypothetical protein DCO17_04240 [Polynucleobacter tropicus]